MDERSGHGSLLPIGSLTARIVSTQQNAAGMPRASQSKPMRSAITTSAKERASSIGTPAGGHGSGTPNGSLPAMRSEAMALIEWRNPKACLTPCIRSSIAEQWTDGDSGSGWDGFVVAYELDKPISEEARREALVTMDALCQPATEAFILAELGKLRAKTASRDAGQNLKLLFAAYADELREYPADLIRETLAEWARTEKWWPSIAELIERLKLLMRPRQALRKALQRGYRASAELPDWMPPSAADKAAVTELLTANDIPLDGQRHEGSLEREPMTPAVRAQLKQEFTDFRLLPEDDPRVQARLREMEEAR
jgi:hypothetical protein